MGDLKVGDTVFDENGIEIPFSQLDVHLMEKANERK